MLTYTIIVNSLVHMCMYSYYLLAVIPNYVPFSLGRLKRYITALQIVSVYVTVLRSKKKKNKTFLFASFRIPATHHCAICLLPPSRTQIQLVSILVNILFAMRTSCAIPRTHILLYAPYMVVLISMFINFYLKTYSGITSALNVCYTGGGLQKKVQ